ncbi:NAD(P)H-hydrate dehydratase [Pseudochrobactrum sp. sp1633]|uniref:NAD(P)H-hydrate dehydratase n=1 Tax=Pseudochrobactrum sp. sp1633 TaxID=3036706 RepID=UPI0025A53EEE|nr:NAD(P)H-hydrate dehydratase [Pseudochrobactrum sp. sp1633]MDM8343936.1 NAD(P)H-hydrate dehydratase [Pseudochrobactrum sp. sp1633]HWD11909.1 NAD(P)H-hydrate dehydratase [Pseudochrobactrum sp.]
MELLTPDEMGQADRITIAGGIDSYDLMQSAGQAVYKECMRLWPEALRIAVLCGHGNNGGDGYVVARLYRQSGRQTYCFFDLPPHDYTDARQALDDYRAEGGDTLPLSKFDPLEFDLIIDAFYGAGLARDITGAIADCIDALNQSGKSVCAIDLPSGVSGLTGQVMGIAVQAEHTVTFFRKKPGHLLQPGRAFCGDVHVCDIGIEPSVLRTISVCLYENRPELWRDVLPVTQTNAHKFTRGHVAVFSGGMLSTGAARLSAAAAARSGAGLVTMIAPHDALSVHAAHLTGTMLHALGETADILRFIRVRKVKAAVLGPAFGDLPRARELICALLADANDEAALKYLVIDADGITAFKDQSQMLFSAAEQSDCAVVLTPHEGEFQRLFGEQVDGAAGKVEKARQAAKLSHCIVINKGPDTVIAAPDGRAAINSNGTALLATAGSGDVLTGIIAGLCAQGMPAFEASCAAAWIHAETANCFAETAPVGMIAEDMPELILKVWAKLEQDRLLHN